MTSIQRRLTVRLAATMALLSGAAGGALFVYLRHGMIGEFDHSLSVRVYALESLVTEHPYGGYDVDVDPQRLPGYAGKSASEFFSIVDPADRVVARSTREPIAFAGPVRDGVAADGVLPDGRTVRAVRRSFVPQIEQDESATVPATKRTATRATLTVVAARDRGPLDAQISRVAAAVGGAVAVLSLAEVAATVLTVGSGLRTLRKIAADLAAADPAKTPVVFDAAAVPVELRPVVQRFNLLLGRVAETLSRERRFNADVAHELRTPIAELRSAAEVALRAPENTALAHRCVVQADEIARQMQAIVTTLLAIVRQELSPTVTTLVQVDLCETAAAVVTRTGLTGRVRISAVTDCSYHVAADPVLLRGVLENVIGNAAEHGTGPVLVAIAFKGERCELAVDNAQYRLTAADLPHLFEPFWRKDVARSDGTHVGLGLTLTRAYCQAMQVEATASLPAPDRFRLTLAFHRSGSPIPELEVCQSH